MAFRLVRICSSEENFEKRLSELKSEFLIPRKYNSKVVEAQFTRVRNLPGEDYKEKRENVLKKKEKGFTGKKNNCPNDFQPQIAKFRKSVQQTLYVKDL